MTICKHEGRRCRPKALRPRDDFGGVRFAAYGRPGYVIGWSRSPQKAALDELPHRSVQPGIAA
jgi:hypothetical protein